MLMCSWEISCNRWLDALREILQISSRSLQLVQWHDLIGRATASLVGSAADHEETWRVSMSLSLRSDSALRLGGVVAARKRDRPTPSNEAPMSNTTTPTTTAASH